MDTAVYLSRQVAPLGCRESALINVESDLYTQGYADWLQDNWHIWRGFCEQADALWARGRRHYSARTIIEWMRHNSAMAESNGDFKINNNFAPDCARLYVSLHPERSDFFQFRVMPSSTRTKYDPAAAKPASAVERPTASSDTGVPPRQTADATVAPKAEPAAHRPEPAPSQAPAAAPAPKHVVTVVPLVPTPTPAPKAEPRPFSFDPFDLNPRAPSKPVAKAPARDPFKL